MAVKAPKFKEDFINQITEGGDTRPEALRKVTIVDVINNRADISDSVKARKLKVAESIGASTVTLGDIADNTPAANTMYESVVKQGFSNPVDSFIGDFKGILAEVGVLGAKTENPLRTRIKSAVGEAAYTNAGFTSDISRLIPLQFPVEVYTESKRIAAALMSNPATKEAGGMMLMSMLGGYRKADFSNLRIENINFETGLVKDLELKTDAPTGGKASKKTRSVPIGYLPSAQRDIIKSVIGDKTSGLVFSNSTKAATVISDALKNSAIPQIEYLQESTGEYIKQDFTFYDYRRIMETSLSSKGYDDDNIVRKALTWRPPSGNVQKYQAVIDASGAIEEANAKAFEPYVLLTEGNKTLDANNNPVLTHGQFLSDVGVTQVSPFTQRYTVTADGVSKLPVHLQQVVEQKSQGISFSDKVITPTSIAIDPQASGTFMELSKEQMETQLIQAKQKRIEEQELLDQRQTQVSEKKKPTDDVTSTATAEEAFPDVAKKVGTTTINMEKAAELAKKYFKNTLSAVAFGGPAAVALTFAEQKKAGATTAEAIGTTVKEELTPYGIAEAVVEPAVKAVGEEIQEQEPEEGFLSGMTRAMTGRGMGTNYSLGGFLDR